MEQLVELRGIDATDRLFTPSRVASATIDTAAFTDAAAVRFAVRVCSR